VVTSTSSTTTPHVLTLPHAPTVLSLPPQASTSATVNPGNTGPPSPGLPVPASSPVVVIGTNTVIPLPSGSGVVLPNGSTATVGAVTTLTDSNNVPVAVSVASSGV
jgi:hypothetical protein